MLCFLQLGMSALCFTNGLHFCSVSHSGKILLKLVLIKEIPTSLHRASGPPQNEGESLKWRCLPEDVQQKDQSKTPQGFQQTNKHTCKKIWLASAEHWAIFGS